MRSGVALALLAAALWGLAPVATKGALAGYSPEMIGVLRLAIAAFVFRRLGGAEAAWFPRDRWSWVSGMALGVDFILYNYGLQLTAAGVSGLVVNVEVVSTIALAVWLLEEQLNRRRIIGSLITLAGVMYVGAADASFDDVTARDHLLGNAMVMAAGMSWSLFAVAQRKAPRTQNLFGLLAPIFSVAALTTMPSLLASSAWRNSGGTESTLLLLILVGLSTVAVYIVYARAQQLVDVSVLAIVLAMIPIFAVAFAWLLLNEPLSMQMIVGGAIILGGVLVISTEPADSEVLKATVGEPPEDPRRR
jgi:drug/metabolite transporter (DMT)-like permease